MSDTVWVRVNPIQLTQDIARIYLKLTVPVEQLTTETSSGPSNESPVVTQEDLSSKGATGTSPYSEAEAATRASIEPRFYVSRRQ